MPIKMESKERSSHRGSLYAYRTSVSSKDPTIKGMSLFYPRHFLFSLQCFILLLLLFLSHVSFIQGFSTQPLRWRGHSYPLSSSANGFSYLESFSCSSCWASRQPIDDNDSRGIERRIDTNRWRAASLFRKVQLHKNHGNHHNHHRRGSWRNVLPSTTSTLLTAFALAGTVLLAASPPAHAAAAAAMANLDFSAVSGGASALALSTSQLWDSLTETGFYQAFSLVFVSEIGDKTFFIAGLLAMKTSRIISFVGSMGALAAMTLVSVIIGQIFHAVPSGIADGIPLDDLAAVFAFTFFGIKTLKEALEIEGSSNGTMDEELAEAKETVEGSATIKQETPWAQIASIFALVFAAEFGDRSFLSTIALSAAQNPVSVAGGAIAAHAVATGIAVSGGSIVAKMLSEKVIGLIGGTLFLVFAVTTALGIF